MIAYFYSFLLLIGLLLGSGCASAPPSVADRIAALQPLLATHHWQQTQLTTDELPLFAAYPQPLLPSEAITLYIEGDGFAWRDRHHPSTNPTPLHPLALLLALRHPDNRVAYLARPCQFIDRSDCSPRYWTDSRFSSEVMTRMNRAVDQLKQRFQAHQITLVGYSGGGAIALLMAARRTDITGVITVAGNLDHRYWSRKQALSRLTGSLNPADFTTQLAALPQHHFSGAADSTVPTAVAQSYQRQLPPTAPSTLTIMEDYTHRCCWVEAWPQLLQQVYRGWRQPPKP